MAEGRLRRYVIAISAAANCHPRSRQLPSAQPPTAIRAAANSHQRSRQQPQAF